MTESSGDKIMTNSPAANDEQDHDYRMSLDEAIACFSDAIGRHKKARSQHQSGGLFYDFLAQWSDPPRPSNRRIEKFEVDALQCDVEKASHWLFNALVRHEARG